MPKDYKNRRRPPDKGGSCWLWLVTGLAVGLLVALFTYLTANPPAHGPMVKAPPPPEPETAARPAPAPPPPERKKPRFEFYSILPEMEVPVHTEALPERQTDKPEAPETGSAYLLQVGSFRGADEAERLKAELALLGMEATIQTVSVNGRQTWHRVRLGPFGSLKAAYRVRDRLARDEMEAIVLKVSS